MRGSFATRQAIVRARGTADVGGGGARRSLPEAWKGPAAANARARPCSWNTDPDSIAALLVHAAWLEASLLAAAAWDRAGRLLTSAPVAISGFPWLVALLGLLVAGAAVAQRIRVPMPVVLAAGGMALAAIPGVPEVQLDPDLILVLFLPPLLYADAFLTSWNDFRRWLRPILMLAIGLVALTIVVVGFVAHALLPQLPLAACMVLGAILSPTDTVAVQAVIERLHIPRRMTAILGGESLVNDATGLVGVHLGVAIVVSGSFDAGASSLMFGRVAGLGLLVGIVVGTVFSAMNRRVRDRNGLFALSLLSPYLAYWLANALEASGVLAVVVAGFIVAWRIHTLPADARVSLYTTWDQLTFVLNGLCFLFVGLEAPHLLALAAEHGQSNLLLIGLAIAATTFVTRLAFCYPSTYLPLWLFPGLRAREGGYPRPRNVFVVSWAGVRGAVSLAAALALPHTITGGEPFPGREAIVVCTMIVVLATLLVQGSTLTPLIAGLGISADEDSAHELRHARQELLAAGVARLDQFCSQTSCPIAVYHLREQMDDELKSLRAVDADELQGARSRLAVSAEVRREVGLAQERRLLELRNSGTINDKSYTVLLLDLDRRNLQGE